MLTEAQFTAEFNLLRKQNFWNQFDNNQLKIILSNMLSVSSSGGATSLISSYSINQNLTAGANLITHNLGLAAPFYTMVSVRTNVGGTQIISTVTSETANSCVLTVATAVSNVNIKIC
jgi:hypothetical protein